MREVGPYDWRLTLQMIGAHTVPGCEQLDVADGRYARLMPSSAGWVRVDLVVGDPTELIVDSDDPVVVDEVFGRVRRWLDLDHDPESLAPWRADPILGPLLARRPGIRRIGYPAAFEAVILTILGQQVSLAAGRTFAGRLVAHYGEPGPGGLQIFPSADRLAGADPVQIQAVTKVTGARARSVLAAAQAFAADPAFAEVGPLPTARLEETSARLLALPGVGPWTVAYLRLRLLGDLDAFPAGDLVVRRALGGVSAAEAERLSLSWRPRRSYAVFSLWAGTAFPAQR